MVCRSGSRSRTWRPRADCPARPVFQWKCSSTQQERAGEAEAHDALERVYDLLGLAIANAHVLVDLELVLISGGMAKMGPGLVAAVTERFNHHCPAELRGGLRLDVAQLGEWAGATGAASLGLDGIQPPA